MTEPVDLAAVRQRLAESAKQAQRMADSAGSADPMTALCRCVGDIAATLSTHEKLHASNTAELARLAGTVALLAPLLNGLNETLREVLRRMPSAPC